MDEDQWRTQYWKLYEQYFKLLYIYRFSQRGK